MPKRSPAELHEILRALLRESLRLRCRGRPTRRVCSTPRVAPTASCAPWSRPGFRTTGSLLALVREVRAESGPGDARSRRDHLRSGLASPQATRQSPGWTRTRSAAWRARIVVARELGEALRADALDAERSDGRGRVERASEHGAFERAGFGEHAEQRAGEGVAGAGRDRPRLRAGRRGRRSSRRRRRAARRTRRVSRRAASDPWPSTARAARRHVVDARRAGAAPRRSRPGDRASSAPRRAACARPRSRSSWCRPRRSAASGPARARRAGARGGCCRAARTGCRRSSRGASA